MINIEFLIQLCFFKKPKFTKIRLFESYPGEGIKNQTMLQNFHNLKVSGFLEL